MPTRNVNLTDRYDRFVQRQVSDGRYKNVSEVMRAALHLLEQQSREDHEKLALLKSLAAEGFDQLDQGQGIELHGPRALTQHIERIGKRAAAMVKRRTSGR